MSDEFPSGDDYPNPEVHGTIENPEDRISTAALREINRLGRARVVWLLERHAGVQCYDHETMDVLVQALKVNVADGTISESVILADEGDGD